MTQNLSRQYLKSQVNSLEENLRHLSVYSRSFILDVSACLNHLVDIQKLEASKKCCRIIVPLFVIHLLDGMKENEYARDAIKYFDSRSSLSDGFLKLQRAQEQMEKYRGISISSQKLDRRDKQLAKALAYFIMNPSCPDESWTIISDESLGLGALFPDVKVTECPPEFSILD